MNIYLIIHFNTDIKLALQSSINLFTRSTKPDFDANQNLHVTIIEKISRNSLVILPSWK